MKLKHLTLFIVITIAVFGAFAHAQFATMENLVINVWPDIPEPNSMVRVQVTSYSFDINSANIEWILNGKTELEGMGKKLAYFKTGEVGSITRLSIKVTGPGGVAITQNFSFNIGEADLLWHAKTYTPPYYSGKPLPSKKSEVVITAMPHLYKNGRKLSADNLVYEWRMDGGNQALKSGFGKQSFRFLIDGITTRNHEIELTVSDLSKSVSAVKTLTISPEAEDVVIYENRPLEGVVYRQAVSEYQTFSGVSHQFAAVPFNFSLDNLNELEYSWRANGEDEPQKPERNYLFDFSSVADAFGRVGVSLDVFHPKKIFQRGSAGFDIIVE